GCCAVQAICSCRFWQLASPHSGSGKIIKQALPKPGPPVFWRSGLRCAIFWLSPQKHHRRLTTN
ncbi:MAG: hypothetical protein ACE37N_08915, partial [Pseudohongiellaceae bacterium]